MRLFQPDPNLPGIETLLDTDAFAERIRTWFCGGSKLTVSIENIRYKPGTSCLVGYRAETATKSFLLHAKAFEKHAWHVRKRKLGKTNRDMWVDNLHSFAAFRFPFDADLPGVKRFMQEPDSFLTRIFSEQYRNDPLVNHSTLAYKPNRRYTAKLAFESGRDLVLKIHDPSTYTSAFKAGCSLRKLPVDVPGWNGNSRRYRAIAHEWIKGYTPGSANLNATELPALMEQVFDFLDRLQRTAVASNVGLPLGSRHDGLEPITNYLAAIYPPGATRLRKMVADILAKPSEPEGPVLAHGDFHERQLVMGRTGIRTCDFDRCCLAESTADIANLLAHLLYRSCVGELPSEIVNQALELSLSKCDEKGPDNRQRFLMNLMASLVRLVTHSFRRGSRKWVEQTEAFLDLMSLQMQMADGPSKTHQKPSLATNVSARWRGTGKRISRSDDVTGESPDSDLRSAILADEKFGFLADSFRLQRAGKMLRQTKPRLTLSCDRLTVANVVARRHKPGRRCLIEFELANHNGPICILGKASAKRLDRRAFETQFDFFHRHGFGYLAQDRICVPRPIGICEPWNMWFQERIDAHDGSRILDTGKLSSVAPQIATTIAKVHNSRFVATRKHRVNDELGILIERLTPMIELVPHRAHAIKRVLKNCLALGSEIDEQLVTPVHRDFYHDQLLFPDQGTMLVDLDLVSMGHPALDVGNFIAHLTEHSIRNFGTSDHWRQAEDLIVSHYLKLNPRCTRESILAFKALSFARHIWISWRIKSRRRWTTRIVDEAELLTFSGFVCNHT